MQREFRWRDDQITALFDSAMRGYPLGTLLLWQVSTDIAKKWKWYRCHSDLPLDRSATKPAAPVLKGARIQSILDGQQRITAFNIGVHGSVTVPGRNGAAPQKHVLWLDVSHQPADLEPDAPRYRFGFHPVDWSTRASEGVWVRVAAAATLTSRSEARQKLAPKPPTAHVDALDRLRIILAKEQVIRWEVFEDDDLDTVLNIFIRANTRATQLGYDDMLLAIASSSWTNDVEVVKTLRRDLDQEFRLGISHTRIMKAGLVLSGAPQVGFRASNLTRARLRAIDKDWEDIHSAIWVAARALHKFGLRRSTLTAENVLIPIATYVHHRGLDENWLRNGSNAKDHERIRQFVFRSLLQPDFWTGAVDQILTTCRQVITSRAQQAHFPLREIEAALSVPKIGKRLAFDDDGIEALLATRYRDRRALLLLTAMYPEAAAQGWLDKDHVFPKSKINANALSQAGIASWHLQGLADMAEQLPNLCLLADADNRYWKRARLPAQWLDEVKKRAGGGQRTSRVQQLDLQHAPAAIAGFESFWTSRRSKSRARVRAVLGTT